MPLVTGLTHRIANDLLYNAVFGYVLTLIKLTVLLYVAVFALNGAAACLCNAEELRVYMCNHLAASSTPYSGARDSQHYGTSDERVHQRAGWVYRWGAATVRWMLDNAVARNLGGLSAYLGGDHCTTMGYAVEWDDSPPGVLTQERTSNMAFIMSNIHDNTITYIQVIFGLFRFMPGRTASDGGQVASTLE